MNTMPPARLAAWLRAHEQACRQLPSWVHASWYQPLGVMSPRSGDAVTAARLATALGLAPTSAPALEQAAHRIAALPSAFLCRVLRARGLLRHRRALRLSLDHQLRRRVMAWVHPVVYDAVLRESVNDLHRDVDGLPLPPSQIDAFPADNLAWEGFCLFERDGAWTDRAVSHRLRLGFPRDMPRPPSLEEHPGALDGTAWVLQRLNRFVPEAPWLFG